MGTLRLRTIIINLSANYEVHRRSQKMVPPPDPPFHVPSPVLLGIFFKVELCGVTGDGLSRSSRHVCTNRYQSLARDSEDRRRLR